MKREVQKYIEWELRQYYQSRAELHEIKSDIIDSTPAGQTGRSSGPSNPTEAKAGRLLSNKRIKKLEETLVAIEYTYNEIDEDKKRLVELMYFKRPRTLTDIGIAHNLCIGRRTLYRWRTEILYRIAKEMGLADY